MTNGEQGPTGVTIRVPLKFTRRGGRKVVSAQTSQDLRSPKPHFDDALLNAVVRAFHWKRQLDEGAFLTVGELAAAQKLNTAFVAQQLRLTLLNPCLVDEILEGRQPKAMQLQLLRRNLPIEWHAQTHLF